MSVEVCNVPGLEDRRSEAAWRRYVALWLDGIEPGWAIPALLAGFIVVWVSTLVLAYWNAGLHPDVLETWSVGREWVWGNAKHPPLMGWVAHGWMSIFPKTDWSFQLLATVNAAIALWSVDLIVRRLARGDKRLIVLLLLLLLPAYDFHAQRFNANSILLAVWPLATYAFLRSFEERSTLWSALAGALGALAMLGKYYSIFLLLSFCFAAICHPRRAQYFGSRAPWISLLIGVAALSPHIQWLWAHDGPTFRYAFDRAGLPFAESLADVVNFYVGIAGFLVLPAIAWLVTIRFRWREWLSDLGALDESLWLLTLIFAGTILFAGVAALALSSSLPGIWHLQALFLPIVVAVCASRIAIDRVETTNLAAAVSLVLLAVLIISPLHAFYRNGHPFKEGRNYYHEAASVLTRRWHAAYGIPLAGVGGDDGLAFAVAFYSPDHPHHGRSSRYREDGWSALCFADDAACMDWMEQISQRFDRKRRFEFVVHKQLWGYPGVSRTIAAIMVPPSATEARPDTPSRR